MNKLIAMSAFILTSLCSTVALADSSKSSGKKMTLLENGFHEMDLNGNSEITKEEAEGIVSSKDFTLADSDNDSKISKKEYLKYFKLKQRAESGK